VVTAVASEWLLVTATAFQTPVAPRKLNAETREPPMRISVRSEDFALFFDRLPQDDCL
jgi:hypothetical protein